MELRFSYAYRPEEYAATMHDLATGAIDGSQFLSDVVGLSGIADAVDRLRSSADQIKIMVDPSSLGRQIDAIQPLAGHIAVLDEPAGRIGNRVDGWARGVAELLPAPGQC